MIVSPEKLSDKKLHEISAGKIFSDLDIILDAMLEQGRRYFRNMALIVLGSAAMIILALSLFAK